MCVFFFLNKKLYYNWYQCKKVGCFVDDNTICDNSTILREGILSALVIKKKKIKILNQQGRLPRNWKS